jgi:NAD+ synthase (glutamine-hydrolysing)
MFDPENAFHKITKGIQEYIKEAGFDKVVIGISGGIDSALVAVLAQKALGNKNVHFLMMPSSYSSPDSLAFGEKLAASLDCDFDVFPIQLILDKYKWVMDKGLYDEIERTVTEENLQARIRANLLMAYANHNDALVLATGNKSEAMMGYCTLYGDTVGALAPIGELYKTQVYELAHYINREKEIIPNEIIEREPSAELSPGQKDTDSLPPYDVLDHILGLYTLSQKHKLDYIRLDGFDKETLKKVFATVEKNKFKTRYYAPTIDWRKE